MLNRSLLPLRALALLCLLMAGLPAARAQPSPPIWDRYYGGGLMGHQEVYSLINARGGGYFAGGLNAIASFDQGAYLMRFNEQGDTLWTHTYRFPFPGQPRITSMVQYSANRLLLTVTSSYLDAAGAFTADAALLVVRASDGGIVRQELLQSPLSDALYSARLVNDTAIVLIKRVLGSYGVVQQDTAGTERWWYGVSYADSLNNWPGAITPVRNGYLLQQQAYNGTSTVHFIDYTGQRLWLRRWAVIPYRSGIALRDAYYFPGSIGLFKTTAQLTSLWQRTVSVFGTNASFDFPIALADGTLLAAGQRWFNGGLPTTDLTLARVDSSGTLLNGWAYYDPTSNEEPMGATLDSQGNYVVLSRISGSFGPSIIHLMKLTPWPSLLGVASAASGDGSALWPNPVTDRARLRLPAGWRGPVQVFNVLGQVVWQQPEVTATEINSTGLDLRPLPPGAYLLRWAEAPGAAPRTVRFLKN